MSRPVLYVAITGHGFGHAVRVCSVIDVISSRYPEILPVIVTTAPHWLLKSYIEGDFIHRVCQFDVGVIQSDSLKMDKAATRTKMQAIRAQQGAMLSGELNFLKNNRVGLILADIPALAVPLAKSAGIPCWMMSNFGWDFIYRDWGESFQEIADWISECYHECDCLFRLPLHEPMSAFPQITDVGLTGGTPRYPESELREKFGITVAPAQTVLLTFGGLGLTAIPYHNLQQFPDWQFITFDREAPSLDNLIRISESHFRPVDFMPICGRVISKPGYSTFAEALRLEIPIVSLTRDDFCEAQILLKGIQDYAYHQILNPETFFKGNWDFLHQPLIPPSQSTPLDKNGAEAIAQAIGDYFSESAVSMKTER